MDSYQVVMIMVAVFQPIAVGLLGWALISLNKLNREVGVNSKGIEHIIEQGRESTKATNRELDTKQDKE